MNNELNDAVVLEQMRHHWQKMLALVLWKVSPNAPVRITGDDIEAMMKQYAPGFPVVFTHGLSDAIELSIVSDKRAVELAAHDAKMRGHA